MLNAMDSVFLLWHIHDKEDTEGHVLIGVYRTEADAKVAIGRLRAKPGFVDAPDGFIYEKYELNRDHWTEGFIRD